MSRESSSRKDPSPFEAFAAPSVSSVRVDTGPYYAHQKTLRAFRQQMLALGVLWIILGTLGGLVGAVVVGSRLGFVDVSGRSLEDIPALMGYVALALAAVWLYAGIGTLMKRMGAVWAGLVMSYLSLLGNLLTLNICSIVLTILVIVQAHRVLGFASQLQRAGVPLDAKP